MMRTNRMRADATVRSALREIERVFDLPTGSVSLLRPDGRRKRGDARIAGLREDWS
jgi:hypothetical protein